MNRLTLLYISFMVSLNCLYAQTLTSISATAEGNEVTITYDLSDGGANGRYSIDVFLSTDGGTNYDTEISKGLIGDINWVSAGTGHTITWRVGDLYPAGLQSSNARFKLRGNASFDMVSIQGGTFEMGCTDEQSGCGSDEYPVHSVTVSDFSIGKYEVTHAQYIAFLNDQRVGADGYYNDVDYGNQLYINISSGAIGHDGSSFYFKGNSSADTDDTPVISVTWYGANAFAKWVGGRLPTEAEWEYAARGGFLASPTLYAGSNTIGDVAWYSGNAGGKTHAVGGKVPNELGLYDMSGNVLEWCQDRYGSYSSSAVTDPQGSESGSFRLLRGGSRVFSATAARVAYRSHDYPNYSSYLYGFRVVSQSK